METTSFCHSHPLVTASVKAVILEDRWEKFLLKEKKKCSPQAHWRNPLIYHVKGYHGLRYVVSIGDTDECERSLQTRRTDMSGEPSVTEAGAEVGDRQK